MLSRELPNFTGILYMMLIQNHYILIEHNYKDQKITGHNSLIPLDDATDAYVSYDVTNQWIMTAFLCREWALRKIRVKIMLQGMAFWCLCLG
jgi:hypothetical protein